MWQISSRPSSNCSRYACDHLTHHIAWNGVYQDVDAVSETSHSDLLRECRACATVPTVPARPGDHGVSSTRTRAAIEYSNSTVNTVCALLRSEHHFAQWTPFTRSLCAETESRVLSVM